MRGGCGERPDVSATASELWVASPAHSASVSNVTRRVLAPVVGWTSRIGAVTVESVAFVRARHALLLLGIAGGFGESVVACSSDRPAPSGGTTGGGTGDVDGSTAGRDALADSSGQRDGSADAADDRPPFSDDGACLDDKPAPTIDGGFKGGNEAGVPICPTTGTCATYCDDIVSHYKLGLAQVAVTCILQLPSCSNVIDVNLCVDNALGASCKDTSSSGYCTPLVKPCDPNAGAPGSLIDEPGCESFANGLSPSGRSSLSTCIQSKIEAGTCPSDVHLCTDQIRQ